MFLEHGANVVQPAAINVSEEDCCEARGWFKALTGADGDRDPAGVHALRASTRKIMLHNEMNTMLKNDLEKKKKEIEQMSDMIGSFGRQRTESVATDSEMAKLKRANVSLNKKCGVAERELQQFAAQVAKLKQELSDSSAELEEAQSVIKQQNEEIVLGPARSARWSVLLLGDDAPQIPIGRAGRTENLCSTIFTKPPLSIATSPKANEGEGGSGSGSGNKAEEIPREIADSAPITMVDDLPSPTSSDPPPPAYSEEVELLHSEINRLMEHNKALMTELEQEKTKKKEEDAETNSPNLELARVLEQNKQLQGELEALEITQRELEASAEEVILSMEEEKKTMLEELQKLRATPKADRRGRRGGRR